MSLATYVPAGDFDDDSDAAFAAIAAHYGDAPAQPAYRPSKAAQRRQAFEQINNQRGIRRHRRTEREV